MDVIQPKVSLPEFGVDLYCGDCLEIMRSMPDDSVDLVLWSPPYEAARTYGIDFKLKGQAWVDWCAERFTECVRVCRGMVVCVVEGQTRKFRYSATPLLLAADLHRAGVHLRKPAAFHRVGVPGSGGPDWLRNDWEFCICGSKGGKLPWSNNTAMGHPPKWAPGGEMCNRKTDGSRVNQWGHSIDSGATVVDEGGVIRSKGKRPSHVYVNGRNQRGGTDHKSSGEGRNTEGDHKQKRTEHGPDGKIISGPSSLPGQKRSFDEKLSLGGKLHTKADSDGMREQVYLPPVLANPGNVIKCLVGGGVMGSKLAHRNEAPYPEALAEFFIKSLCPPGGVVMDICSGSGTTVCVASRNSRRGIGIDIRQSQIDLTIERLHEPPKPAKPSRKSPRTTHTTKKQCVKVLPGQQSLFPE